MTIRKAALFAGSMLFTAASASIAIAQTNSNNNPAPAVVVTGTRIPKPNLDQPVPVEQVTQQIIQNSGTPDLGQVLATLPSMGVQGTVRANSNSFNNFGGLSFADLRNLGVARTLTLVDGQRHVAADPGSLAVDLGSIPPALVDRVEVVTGGASAIYGSDALAGVVNIILKKRFVGVQAQEQAGYFPDGGYGFNESGYLTVGRNFAGDRGNINATLVWDTNGQVLAKDVPSMHNFGSIVNPIYGTDPFAAPVPANGVPERFEVANIESEFISNTGVLVDPFTFIPYETFTKDGTPIPQQQRIATNSVAFGELPGCTTCFKLEDYELIIPKTDREGGDVRLSYDITPHLNFSIDAKYIQREIYDFNQPSFSFFTFILPPDNAFITPAIASAIAAEPSGAGVVFLDRFLGDAGARTTFARRDTGRVVPTLKGDFDAKFAQVNWDASFNYGETDNYFSDRNILIPGNFAAAEDSVIDPATGQPACRINVPSAPPNPFTGEGFGNPPPGLVGPASACIPYNPFGLQDSRKVIQYTRATVQESQRLYQEVADLNASFDTSRFFNLPGGPIAVAAGLEWRKEHVSDNQDPLVQAGLTENAPTPNFSNGFEVTEGYVEVNVPVFKHKGFLLDELTFDVADRNAQYTTVGNVNAWKASVVYGPIPGLKFRGDYSVAVRAPNLTEFFLPPSGGFFGLPDLDPCDAANIHSGTATRFANCQALLASIPGAPAAGTFTDTAVNVSPPGITTGNDKLTPEQGTSYTIGIVFQPTFLKQFSLTVDYYNIDIKNAIIEPAAQDIVDNCVDGPSLDASFCNLVERAGAPGASHETPVVGGFRNQEGQIIQVGDIGFITDTFLNQSRLFTDGIEVQANYAFWLDPFHFKVSRDSDLPGKVTVSLDYNYLMHLHDFPFKTAPKTYTVAEGTVVNGTPYNRARADITYDQGPFSAIWTVRYVGQGANFNRSPGQPVYASNAIVPAYTPAQVYNDLVVHYKLPTWKGTTDLFVGANDLFNVKPPIGVIGGNNGGPDGSALYDLGIYVFAGARVRY
ncbi:MAG TPA: TonB-dependent receptor [Caulobacteraceae bacterium]|nr:TonB-dependent receptor [Caulobacteraceae bacterium]